VAGTLPDLAEAAASDGSDGRAGSDGTDGADGAGKVRLDHTRNAADAGPAAPWSVRAAPGAPVVVPLGWDELDDAKLRPDRWTIRTADSRLEDAGDPLAPIAGTPQDLPRL
jgi:bifunctional non-homologous end joining protein LigD